MACAQLDMDQRRVLLHAAMRPIAAARLRLLRRVLRFGSDGDRDGAATLDAVGARHPGRHQLRLLPARDRALLRAARPRQAA